jgi:hypothetical protein
MFIYQGKLNWYNYAQDELFVIVLPFGVARLNDPIHLYWQWTKLDNGSTKVNVLSRSFISSVTETAIDGEDQFSCVHDDYYTFDIVSKRHYDELHVTMRNLSGDTSSDMILRVVSKEDDSDPEPLEKARPRIHVGKLNWYEYAINELFVVILPLGLCGDQPVCALWQWTKKADGQEKYNVKAISTQTCGTGLANKFHFTQEGYYTFSCEADKSNEDLKITMSNPAGDSVVQNPLTSQEIVNKSNDSDGRRRKRALFDYTTQIENDLDDIVMCTFSPSSSSSGGKLLAAGGFGLALAGFIPLVVVSTPPIIGWALAIAGVVAATTGVVDVAIAGAEPTTRPVFPGDVTSNTSSGGFIVSANNISILHAFVKDGKQLTIRNGKASDVNEDVYWRLSDSTRLTWETIFKLEFPKKQHIVSYRGMQIRYLQPAWDGKSAGDIDSDASPTDYALSIEKDGTDISYYDLKIPKYQRTIFRIAPTRHFVVTQSLKQAKTSQPTGDYTILPLPNGHVLVRVNNCLVTGTYGKSNYELNNTAYSEDDVKRLIVHNPNGLAYIHDIQRDLLITWLRYVAAHQSFTRSLGYNTYFLVPGMHVTTRQLVVEGEAE